MRCSQWYAEEEVTQVQGLYISVYPLDLVPAALSLRLPSSFGFSRGERRWWRVFSHAAFACIVLLLVLPSSSAVDRPALYILPLRVAVLARIPQVYSA